MWKCLKSATTWKGNCAGWSLFLRVSSGGWLREKRKSSFFYNKNFWHLWRAANRRRWICFLYNKIVAIVKTRKNSPKFTWAINWLMATASLSTFRNKSQYHKFQRRPKYFTHFLEDVWTTVGEASILCANRLSMIRWEKKLLYLINGNLFDVDANFLW